MDSDGFALRLVLLWKAGTVLGEEGLDLSLRPYSLKSKALAASFIEAVGFPWLRLEIICLLYLPCA